MNTVNEKKERRWNLAMLFMILLVYSCVNLQRSSIPGAIFNELQTDFDASASSVAAIGAVLMYTYAATQLLAGPLADKFGGARTILGGGILFTVGSLIFPLGGQLWLVMASRFLIGLGAGAIYLSMVKEIERLFPNHFSMALGTALLVGYSGSMLGGFPLVKAVTAFSWRHCFFAVALFTLASYLMTLFCRSRVTLPPIRPGRLSVGALTGVLRTRMGRLALVACGLSFGLYYMMLTVVGKKFLEDFSGISPAVASTVLTAMVAISSGGNFLCGILTALCGNRRKPFLLIGLGTPLVGALMGLTGIYFHFGSVWMIVAMLCFGVGAAISPVTTSLMREVTEPGNTGAAVCSLNFWAYASVALYANLAGLFMDWFSFGKAVRVADAVLYPASSYVSIFGLALAVALITFAAGCCLPETKGQNVYGKVK